MKQKDNIKLQAISLLDEEIIDKNTEKRCILLHKSAVRRAKQIWTSALSMAACLAIIISGISIFLYRQTIPVYQGMTVSSAAPAFTETAMAESYPAHYLNNASSLLPGALASLATTETASAGPYSVRYLRKAAFLSPEVLTSLAVADAKTDRKPNKETDQESFAFTTDRYYAQPNQDIYITVHIDNPSGYEILSFTLNGIKYSSYMFEEGSDLENLILKVNVGADTGVREFTIDQIKYVKGDKIRNVIMDGDDTVRIIVTPHALVEQEGMDMLIRYDQMQDYLGIEEFTGLSLYENGVKLYDLEKGTERIKGLPFDRAYELVGSYTKDGKAETFSYPFLSPQSSRGLLIVGGKIAGVGTCTDNVLYLNLPLADSAFAGCSHIQTVYMGAGVTSIGNSAFADCAELTHVSLPEAMTEISTGAFLGCKALTSVDLPDGVTTIGAMAFMGISDLSITLPSTVTKLKEFSFANCPNLTIHYEGTQAQWDAVAKDDDWFRNTSGNFSIKGSVYCTDGIVSISGEGIG